MKNSEEMIGPASLSQRLLWVFEKRRAVRGALSSAIVIRSRGPWNHEAFGKAVNELIGRHETLRTRMRWDNSRLTRVVSPAWRPSVARTDLSTQTNPVLECESILKREFTTDLPSTDWPVRLSVIRLAQEDHVVCLIIHHMATDMVSNQIIVTDLANLYRAAIGDDVERLPSIEWQYSKWVDWQLREFEARGEARHSEYWAKQLEGAVGRTQENPG